MALVVFGVAYSKESARPSYLLIAAFLIVPWAGWLAWREATDRSFPGGLTAVYVVLGFLLAGWISYGAVTDIPYLIHLQEGAGMVLFATK